MKRFYIALGMYIAIVAFSIYGHIAVMKSFESMEESLKMCLEAAEKEDTNAILENLNKAEERWEKTTWLIGSVYSHQTIIEMQHIFLTIRGLVELNDMEHIKERTAELIAYIETSNKSIGIKPDNIF